MKTTPKRTPLSILPAGKTSEPAFFRWPELVEGVLIKRYKRFLADIFLKDGSTITAHCPNSGSMKTCSEKGSRVWVSASSNPSRKLMYTWELIEIEESLVGVNAIIPNRLVQMFLCNSEIKEVAGYSEIIPEITINKGTRLDFCIQSENRTPCFLEVKNCTYVENRLACFPDAITERGKKHVEELARLVSEGKRGVVLFIIQRMDADVFAPAGHIDPRYAEALRNAVLSGVEVIAYDTLIDLSGIRLGKSIPVLL